MAERMPRQGTKRARHTQRLEGNDAVRHLWDIGLVIRMQVITKDATLREIGDATGVHPETVRRYLADGRPSAYFLAGLCRSFNVDPWWLLFGHWNASQGSQESILCDDSKFSNPLIEVEPKPQPPRADPTSVDANPLDFL